MAGVHVEEHTVDLRSSVRKKWEVEVVAAFEDELASMRYLLAAFAQGLSAMMQAAAAGSFVVAVVQHMLVAVGSMGMVVHGMPQDSTQPCFGTRSEEVIVEDRKTAVAGLSEHGLVYMAFLASVHSVGASLMQSSVVLVLVRTVGVGAHQQEKSTDSAVPQGPTLVLKTSLQDDTLERAVIGRVGLTGYHHAISKQLKRWVLLECWSSRQGAKSWVHC